ncbi:unnamed protein product [Orchesella dallaii]|uniref:Uncharacterized protein n=1 Tax=Orchesella dallaii TaxID=48710 RepID=A0ABP1PWU8_9HEXA
MARNFWQSNPPRLPPPSHYKPQSSTGSFPIIYNYHNLHQTQLQRHQQVAQSSWNSNSAIVPSPPSFPTNTNHHHHQQQKQQQQTQPFGATGQQQKYSFPHNTDGGNIHESRQYFGHAEVQPKDTPGTNAPQAKETHFIQQEIDTSTQQSFTETVQSYENEKLQSGVKRIRKHTQFVQNIQCDHASDKKKITDEVSPKLSPSLPQTLFENTENGKVEASIVGEEILMLHKTFQVDIKDLRWQFSYLSEELKKSQCEPLESSEQLREQQRTKFFQLLQKLTDKFELVEKQFVEYISLFKSHVEIVRRESNTTATIPHQVFRASGAMSQEVAKKIADQEEYIGKLEFRGKLLVSQLRKRHLDCENFKRMIQAQSAQHEEHIQSLHRFYIGSKLIEILEVQTRNTELKSENTDLKKRNGELEAMLQMNIVVEEVMTSSEDE